MKETRADTRNALLQATCLHVLLFALMFAGLHWTRSNVAEPAQGDVIEADLIDPSALSASMQRALQRDPKELPKPVVEPTPVPPQPVPDPLPDPLPTPEDLPPPPITPPDKVDQPKVQRDAPTPDPAVAQREQEAKQREQQVDLDAAQRQKVLAEIRKQREQASRELSIAEQKAQQLADAKAQQTQSRAPPPGYPDSRASHNASYIAALQAAILRQWTRPESVRIGQQCQVLIRQIPGGEVVSVQVAPDCPYDELGRRSVEAAVLKASPLPYAGYEDAFVRDPVFTFRAEDQ